MENSFDKNKKLKSIELEMLKLFIDICEKLKLRYYIVGGTLLGAVRHKGFIPWDDDIDVAMLREDYEIFMDQSQKYFPDEFFVQSYKSEKQWMRHFIKIRNSRTTFIEIPCKNLNINHGIFIDVFPLNYTNKKKFSVYNKLLNIYEYKLLNFKKSFKYKITIPFIKLLTFTFTAKKAFQKREKLIKSKKDGKYLAFFNGSYGEKEIFPKEWFGEGTKLEFEGIQVNAPVEYEKYLTQVYGDYMTPPPEEKRIPHHYNEIIDTENSYKKYIK